MSAQVIAMSRIPKRIHVESLPANAVQIPDYPKYYITPEGEIFSLYENKINKRRFGLNGAGYPICGLQDETGKVKYHLVHRIVAKLFVPGDQTLTVNHIDMDKTNCRASNIEWVSLSENHRKARAILKEWSQKTSESVSKAIVATDPTSGLKTRFPSLKQAALHVGNPTASGNISRAATQRTLAYGLLWRRCR